MILLFSLMAFLTTAANLLYFLRLEMDALTNSTISNLTAVGGKMIDEIQQYVQLMDYAMESMISNAKFMEAVYRLDQLGGDADVVTAQTLISQSLYHSPINGRFYRVSVFNKNGLYISSQFENTGMIPSLSDEARDVVAELSCLAAVGKDVYHSHLIAPHRDPWNTVRDTQVFSAIRAAVWRGRAVGYLEVSAHVYDLEKIFSVSGLDELTVQAVFDDGGVLYASQSLDTPVTPQSSESPLTVTLHSKQLGLKVSITQSAAARDQSVRSLIVRYVSIAGSILAAAVFIIVLLSFRLTNSVRKLTKKVRAVSVSDMLDLETPAVSATVTSPGDAEIYDLERVFDDLTRRLRISMNNEITMWRANLRAQLDALQAQINPHFIYNTLNIISAKGMECGNEEIIAICDQFAQMLRYSTNLNNSSATLGDELNHAHSYLRLVKARYEDRLSYAISVPAGADRLPIPRLILQPLVENTIRHGYIDGDQAIHIDIHGEYVPEGLRLTIRDNGQGFSTQALEKLHLAFAQIDGSTTYDKEAAGGHIGLANTYMRLTYYGGGRIAMRLYNDSGAVIELTIPLGTEGKNELQRAPCG